MRKGLESAVIAISLGQKEEKKDKPDIGEVIEEFKRKNKSKDGSLSYGDNSNNSFILNNK